MKVNLFFLFVIIAGIKAFSQNIAKYDKIDSLLTEMYGSQQFSGVVVIAQGEEIKYSKAFGFADYEKKIPLKLSTQFDLSSGSKLFTSVSIAQLVEQGNVAFTDKVSDYFPELPFGSKVTIHQLLTHSSGLGNFQTSPGFSYEDIGSCSDVLPYIRNEPLKFNPGDSVLYGTSNLLILGAIVEKVSNQSFQKYVERHIIKPLNLKRTSFDTYFNVQDYPGRDSKFAKGYNKDDQGKIIEKKRYSSQNTFVTLSAGGMWASALDLLTFDRAVFSGKLIESELLTTMTTKYSFSGWEGTYFGYVYNIVNYNSHKEGVGHAGNSSGHHSYNFHYENGNTTLIILTNYGFVDIFELAHGQIERMLFD